MYSHETFLSCIRYPLSVNISGDFLLEGDRLTKDNMQLFASLPADVKQKIIDTRTLPPGSVKVGFFFKIGGYKLK
jgi:hypothetical protein